MLRKETLKNSEEMEVALIGSSAASEEMDEFAHERRHGRPQKELYKD